MSEVTLVPNKPVNANEFGNSPVITLGPTDTIWVASEEGSTFTFAVMGIMINGSDGTIACVNDGLDPGPGATGNTIYTCPDGMIAIVRVTAANGGASAAGFTVTYTYGPPPA